ncbi:DUF6318 family protein [Aeromicrobium sp. Sec7.5]|uniref:DUF6318 family protein n=1 Tax=Aeromicrobium sp. Sec7.5 TaxID=3121276 RepID=UPI002FE4975C
MRRTSWPFLALAAVLLAGCAGDPEPKEPDASTTPSPTATPPPLPEAATQETAEGAAAFVDHYLDVLNYAAHTGDTASLRALTGPECGSCDKYMAVVDATHDAGGAYTGGDWSAGDVAVSFQGTEWRIEGEVTTEPGTFDNGSDPAEETAPSTIMVAFLAQHVEGKWLMSDFVEPGK